MDEINLALNQIETLIGNTSNSVKPKTGEARLKIMILQSELLGTKTDLLKLKLKLVQHKKWSKSWTKNNQTNLSTGKNERSTSAITNQ